MGWAGNVERMMRTNSYRVLVGKLERKRLLGRRNPRYECNTKMDLGEIGWEGVDLN
jgi:hypothetical protein